MNGDILQFDPHFIACSVDKEFKVSEQVWNRQLLVQDDSLPERGEDIRTPPVILQLSTGWILIHYMWGLGRGVAYNPRTKEKKELKERRRELRVVEFPGTVLFLEATASLLKTKFLIYNSEWELTKEVVVGIPTTGRFLALNPGVFVAGTSFGIFIYSYPQLWKLKEDKTDRGYPKDIVRISDSVFLIAYEHEMVMMDKDLKELRSFSMIPVFTKGKKPGNRIYSLYSLSGNRFLVVTIHQTIPEEETGENMLGLTVFRVDKDSPSKLVVGKLIPNFYINPSLFGYGYAFIPETEEVLCLTSDKELLSANLNTCETMFLKEFPKELTKIVYVKWPPTKAEYVQAVKRMKTLWKGKVPVPDDVLGVLAKFIG